MAPWKCGSARWVPIYVHERVISGMHWFDDLYLIMYTHSWPAYGWWRDTSTFTHEAKAYGWWRDTSTLTHEAKALSPCYLSGLTTVHAHPRRPLPWHLLPLLPCLSTRLGSSTPRPTEEAKQKTGLFKIHVLVGCVWFIISSVVMRTWRTLVSQTTLRVQMYQATSSFTRLATATCM